MKCVIIPLREATVLIQKLQRLDSVNVIWGIKAVVGVCGSANPRHDYFDLTHLKRYVRLAIWEGAFVVRAEKYFKLRLMIFWKV